jgi:choline-glycine betaine transporter
MMLGAGIGIGMLTFATAEPMYHFAKNPSTIMGPEGSTWAMFATLYIWSFTHWDWLHGRRTPSLVPGYYFFVSSRPAVDYSTRR